MNGLGCNSRYLEHGQKILISYSTLSADKESQNSHEVVFRIHNQSLTIYFTETLPDAINSDCEKCTEKQKMGSEKVTHYIIDNRPDDWAELEKIYDPSGKYRINYLAQKQNDSANNDESEKNQ